MSKVFSHAGVSRLDGKFKVRFANDALRVKVLAKNGHSDIDIIELKVPMTKEDAVQYLLQIDFDNGNAEVRAALEAEVDKRVDAPEAANKEQRPKKEAKKPKQPKKAAPSLESIKAKAAAQVKTTKQALQDTADELDDAPF